MAKLSAHPSDIARFHRYVPSRDDPGFAAENIHLLLGTDDYVAAPRSGFALRPEAEGGDRPVEAARAVDRVPRGRGPRHRRDAGARRRRGASTLPSTALPSQSAGGR
ncbi:MAG: hypothetical protein GY854_30065 [Deltaproteobacteria bacterium]|nr:hypothetical protein [Deltaproteobacteria bacterium]